MAFRELVNNYQGKVLNTAAGMVQDIGTAEDITQEVFVTVFKNILSFNEKSSISTWIYRITVNKCLDHLRAQKRGKRFGMLFRLGNDDDGSGNIAAPDFVHPGVLAENREKSIFLFRAIAQLPDNQKTAFVLTHIEEVPQKEIAVIMDISLKAVESLLQRAKANLRKELGALFG